MSKKDERRAKGAVVTRVSAPRPEAPPRAASPAAQVGELIDVGEAVKLLKASRPTFYRWLRMGKIKGMKVGRQWRFDRREVERFLKGEEPRIELPATLKPLVKTLEARAAQLGIKLGPPSDANEVRRAVSLMIHIGVAMRASDVHLAPYVKAEAGPPVAVLSCRVDGVINPIAEFDVRLLAPLAEYWKTLANCNVQEKRVPQDGRILITLNEPAKKNLDLRVNFLPAALGESVTARILDPSVVRLEIDRLGYAPRDKERLLRWLKVPWGVIVVTGPTGSGKTTALYSCLKQVATPQIKAMSVEDPVEFFLPHVVQTQLRPSAGVTFSTAMRAILRSSPDVILVGEIRDRETLMISQQAALTGHLVLTTLHTEDAAGALTRMVDIGSDPFIVCDSTRLIVAQRLVRKLCAECKAARTPPHDLLEDAEKLARAGGLDWGRLPKGFHEPVGCPKCHQSGYRGRSAIAEALEVTREIAAALRRGAKTDELRAIAVGQGMVTLAADGVEKAATGLTSLVEVFHTIGIR